MLGVGCRSAISGKLTRPYRYAISSGPKVLIPGFFLMVEGQHVHGVVAANEC